MASDVQWALKEFSPRSPRLKDYGLYQRYYDGDQPLAFATRKYRSQFWRLFKGYCDNMCQSVVDVQAERLEVIGFTSSGAVPTTVTYDAEGNLVEDGAPPPVVTNPDPLIPDQPAKTVTITLVEDDQGEQAWEEWEDESMPLVADQVHSDVLLYGDAFVMADENGVWRQEPSEIAVRYSKEQPGVLEAAAKFWKDDDGHGRLNIYTPAGLTKFRSARPLEKGKDMKEADFESVEGGGTLPQGIPVIHFANKKYGRYGISELASVLPLQDALNKAEMDLMISMEYQAFRQRWLTGVDVDLDPVTGLPLNFPGQHGPGNFLSFSDPETKVGEFAGAELKPYVDVIENLRAQIARVSGIPPHYFFVGSSGATVSGETLKVSESRFTRKGKRQQRCFGKGWENVMDLVLEISSTQHDDATYDEATDLNALWDEVTPRSESEDMDVLIKKGTIGVPNSQLQREAGYDPDEIQTFAVEYAQNVKAGLQAGPKQAGDGSAAASIPQGSGESTNGATSAVSAKPGTAPAQD